MRTSRVLTPSQLEAAGACPSAVERFRALFGESVEVTATIAAQHASEFPFEWASRHLLSPPARRVYEAVIADPWRVYQAARAEAQRVFDAADVEAWRVYRAARAEAWRVFEAADAEAWAIAYISDHQETTP